MNWAITDRITRTNFYATLVLAGLALAPLLFDRYSLILMAAALVLVYRAWRLAIARQVRVTIDQTGISKTIGGRSWHLNWQQVTAVGLARWLGGAQLVLDLDSEAGWSSSDKLYFRLRRNQVAIEVPDALVPGLRELLAEHDLVLA
jgi:hypothetical protein